MIRLWEKFTVVQHQVLVTNLVVTRRSRGFLACFLETAQKYPEIRSWSGFEVLVGASGPTPKDTYDPAAPATSVVFPPSLRGWGVTWRADRYSLALTLCKPAQTGVSALQVRDESWRVAQFARAD